VSAEPFLEDVEPGDAGPADWQDDPTALADVDAYLNDVPALAGSFEDRVTSRRVDLLQRLEEGLPPIEYLPASDRMLRRGKRHQWAAPKKVGKSLGALVHAVDVVLAGGAVVIFDRENGADLYASRLDAIIAARLLTDEQRQRMADGLAYYEFPRFRDSDRGELVELCAGADLVVFDSQRMYLSDLGLEENSSDDYADFMAALIDPLFVAGIATLILDNTGHAEPKRARGNSAKGDLNETLFALETVERFNVDVAGLLRLEITESRFGNSGRWELDIGAGVFGSWRLVDDSSADEYAGFRPTELMERASIFLESCSELPVRSAIVDEIGGKKRYARIAVERLIQEGYARGAKGQGVELIKRYRQADDPLSEAGRNG
jgi:hypothetical protein